eukprot:TRINITY_DN11064_c0_g1_i8.p1 TRINITY_DN11064_c0_g1~~TRINITY_DN11064_c0_g1_i8.p1  ORF type:complete len:180 (+),score=37.73 TRINITY_DN11064_c0_g1_i8:527-1066(+)
MLGFGTCGSQDFDVHAYMQDAFMRAEYCFSGTAHMACVLGCMKASQVGDIMGGSSGAIYSILLTTLGSRLNDEKMPTPRQLGKALSASLAVVTEYGGAREGDCTMLDVWYPVARELLARDVTWARVAETAARAAANTAQLRPMAGRASYVNQAHSNNVMDPGAVAASEFIQAAVESLAS